MPPWPHVLLAVAALVGLAGCGAAASGPTLERGADTPSPSVSTRSPLGAAPTLRVELRLVGLMFVEGGYGVVAVSEGPGGNELARGAVQLVESGTVVLEVTAGTLEVRAWTHGCDPSGCSELTDVELDTLRPYSEDLCTTSVTVTPADSGRQEPPQTQLLYQYGALAPDNTWATCRLAVVP